MKKYKKYKDYKVFVDPKMRWQGDTDTEKKVIRINPVKSKQKSSLISTVVHEKLHADHPDWPEKKVYKREPIVVRGLNEAEKKRLYRLTK